MQDIPRFGVHSRKSGMDASLRSFSWVGSATARLKDRWLPGCADYRGAGRPCASAGDFPRCWPSAVDIAAQRT